MYWCIYSVSQKNVTKENLIRIILRQSMNYRNIAFDLNPNFSQFPNFMKMQQPTCDKTQCLIFINSQDSQL